MRENDLRHNDERRTELTQQIANAEESSRSFDDAIKEFRSKIEEKTAEVERFEKQRTNLQEKLSAMAEQNAESDKVYSALEQELARIYRERSEADVRSVQAERSAAEAEEQKQTFLSDVQNSEAKLKEYSDSAAPGREITSGGRREALRDGQTSLRDISASTTARFAA